ncbi:circadian clock protein KaiC [Methylotuvimicrobium sp. KM2]|uniref:circadian clock protein KaiC n=1 Tax=Methylotuvimicrobium sp. KM2 TaxID=3133976 RepID=UPI00310178E0
MKKTMKTLPDQISSLFPKSPTGIRGLDDITGGGLPTGRPTLVCGGAGCGKTLLAMEFLVHGAVSYSEPGVFMTFEETSADLAKNVASLGFDLPALIADKKLLVDHVAIERSEIEETGEYDLGGLFIRLGHAIDSIGAKRVALDTVEALFSALPNQAILRAELRRLFRFLRDKNVTVVITGERGEAILARHGIEEYLSDCVIILDHCVSEQMSTRRLRVAKYRGSMHGTNEYPFLIDEQGIFVLPVTSLGLNHEVSMERIPTGIARLDTMLGGQGYFRGSSILISGTAGCGKTSVAAHLADATCRREERCLSFLFEESPNQLMRNMRSIGLDLQPWLENGLLRLQAVRPSLYGLEMHLAAMLKAIDEFQPSVVIVDPISSFSAASSPFQVKSMLIRLVDYLKVKGITAMLVYLTTGGSAPEYTDMEISSLIDTWLLLRDIEQNGECNRGMYVLKSRGMAHSNQIREFKLTERGVELLDVYVGLDGVLTGSARLAQEAKERAELEASQLDMEEQQAALEYKRHMLESQIAALRAEFAATEVEVKRLIRQGEQRRERLEHDMAAMRRIRHADAAAANHQEKTK